MDNENIVDHVAEQLGFAHTAITTIIERQPSNETEEPILFCSDDSIVILEYAQSFIDAAFSQLERLNAQDKRL